MSELTDEIFDDDEDDDEDILANLGAKTPPKRTYLDETWDLIAEDKQEVIANEDEEDEAIEQFMAKWDINDYQHNLPEASDLPTYALLFVLKPEFNYPIDITGSLEAHRKYAESFKRYMGTQIINLSEARTIVVFFTAKDEDDLEDTEAEITAYLENNPLSERELIEDLKVVPLTGLDQDGNPFTEEDYEEYLEWERAEVQKLQTTRQ